MTTANTLLDIHQLQAHYGAAQALFDINLTVKEGQFVTLLGRNGMGKTTTIRAICGILPALGGRAVGQLQVMGRDALSLPAYKIAQTGIGLVPESRQVFPNLTVHENLVATARGQTQSGAWTTQRVYALFPRLKEREKNLGVNLSGGEQQMLAIGRALMTNPKLLILDEATEGLAPIVRAEIWDCLAQLKGSGLAILVIDKNLNALLNLADCHYLIEKGRTIWSGTSQQLKAEPTLLSSSLGI